MVTPAKSSTSARPPTLVTNTLSVTNAPHLAKHSHPLLWTLCFVFVESVSSMEELDHSIMQLGSDDFEEREAASAELGVLAAGYARVFLKLAASIDNDLEIKDRLFKAAKSIFEKKIGSKDERWLKIHGALNISYQPYYVTQSIDGKTNREFLGMAVSWVDKEGACDKHLQKWDVITAIDGVAMGNRDLDSLVKPGTSYELTVRRYVTVTTLENKTEIAADESFEEHKIKVTAGWRAPQNVDQYYARVLMDRLWKDFLAEYRNPFNLEFSALR
jgi:hypothetical protein